MQVMEVQAKRKLLPYGALKAIAKSENMEYGEIRDITVNGASSPKREKVLQLVECILKNFSGHNRMKLSAL
jgi:hypothetical protein